MAIALKIFKKRKYRIYENEKWITLRKNTIKSMQTQRNTIY